MKRRADRSPAAWMPRTPLGWAVAALGLGTLVAGATTLVVLLVLAAVAAAPIAVWLAWNVLDFAGAIGAPELGLLGILLLTLFLICGFGGRLAIALIVWLVDPAWLHQSGRLHWPQPSVRTFVALLLVLAVAQVPRRHSHRSSAGSATNASARARV
jgi:hypothetical protein